jgi:hypothetical protein
VPRVIDVADETAISLPECVAAMRSAGFDPAEEESLMHAARQLRRLGNNRSFLGDMLVEQLRSRHREEESRNSYGPQVLMLAPADGGPFFMRANIWPSQDEHVMRASGGASFVYGLPHDHNFDFLTLGYSGPGYWSDYYEYDYAETAGWSGEPVDLRFVETARLDEGRIMHYRAHRDVHAQRPADALSISINILHASGAQGWLDQYGFDIENRRISRILSNGSSEAFIRIAAGLGGAEALDLAERFARNHPSDRMRLAAWGALASVARGTAARDEVWRRAEQGGSRLVAAEARSRRSMLHARHKIFG